jgi:hypothetical protein
MAPPPRIPAKVEIKNYKILTSFNSPVNNGRFHSFTEDFHPGIEQKSSNFLIIILFNKSSMYKNAFIAFISIASILIFSCESSNSREVSYESDVTLQPYHPNNELLEESNADLSYIRKYLGKRPSEVKLWNREPLKSELQKTLGKEYNNFLELMENAMPLKEENVIYSVGSHPDRSLICFGYIIIDPDKNILRAGMVKPGSHRTFGAKVSEIETPEVIERKCQSIL